MATCYFNQAPSARPWCGDVEEKEIMIMKADTKDRLKVLWIVVGGLLFFGLLNLLIAWLFSASIIFQILWVLAIYIIPELLFLFILGYLCYLGIQSLNNRR